MLPTAGAGRLQTASACIFCRILAGVVPAGIVVEMKRVAAFTTHQPYHPGHVLVVPRPHIATIYELPDDLTASLFQVTARVARAAKATFEADGITIRQHNEAAGGQEVAHLHVHVIPRYVGDDECLKRIPPIVDLTEQRQAAARLWATLMREGAWHGLDH
jgi:histidine triad (HIT) family protein